MTPIHCPDKSVEMTDEELHAIDKGLIKVKSWMISHLVNNIRMLKIRRRQLMEANVQLGLKLNAANTTIKQMENARAIDERELRKKKEVLRKKAARAKLRVIKSRR